MLAGVSVSSLFISADLFGLCAANVIATFKCVTDPMTRGMFCK